MLLTVHGYTFVCMCLCILYVSLTVDHFACLHPVCFHHCHCRYYLVVYMWLSFHPNLEMLTLYLLLLSVNISHYIRPHIWSIVDLWTTEIFHSGKIFGLKKRNNGGHKMSALDWNTWPMFVCVGLFVIHQCASEVPGFSFSTHRLSPCFLLILEDLISILLLNDTDSHLNLLDVVFLFYLTCVSAGGVSLDQGNTVHTFHLVIVLLSFDFFSYFYHKLLKDCFH